MEHFNLLQFALLKLLHYAVDTNSKLPASAFKLQAHNCSREHLFICLFIYQTIIAKYLQEHGKLID